MYEGLTLSSATGGAADARVLDMLLQKLEQASSSGPLKQGTVAVLVEIGKSRFQCALRMNCCKTCGQAGGVRPCSRCKAAKYCCQECNVASWPLHKAACRFVERRLPLP